MIAAALEQANTSWRAHALAGALCAGIAAANAVRWNSPGVAAAAVVVGGAGVVTQPPARLALLAAALAVLGWWWGSARLDALDRSPLLARIGTAELARVAVVGPPASGRFEQRIPAEVTRFGTVGIQERVLLELPLGKSPPQGAILQVLGTLALPRGPDAGFDERTYLRRHGVHVVLRGDRWRVVGRRGGLGAVADRTRGWLASAIVGRLRGQRRALVEGVVLGDDSAMTDGLRNDFRASGLYHLLAVSGENVAIVAGLALALAWVVGLPRLVGQLVALASIAAYVIAVGPQPSVIRAGVAGALTSVAWLAARATDRWYFLLLGALVLLGWNPYVVFDAGFQLSFAAVIAIFVLYPRIERWLEGYPVPRSLRRAVAVSSACGIATAPILWLQFHALPLLTVPANAAADPAVVPLLVLAFATAAAHAAWPPAATALASLNGWCAAYLARCAHAVAAVPFAQVRSAAAAAALAAVAVAVGAYAWRRRWRMS